MCFLLVNIISLYYVIIGDHLDAVKQLLQELFQKWRNLGLLNLVRQVTELQMSKKRLKKLAVTYPLLVKKLLFLLMRFTGE